MGLSMNGRDSGSNEMLYIPCLVGEWTKLGVVISGKSPKWDEVEICCIHKSLAFEVHEQGVGMQKVGS